eukprot:CAMPEP_0113820836 /NCGR_PEP_ID=MMETSP0328-20130328/1438_1 /TAXON_ID=39455 /ORGANISM="Alexandrium minutum" /LENGTH=292 /DNA_ID=CAMNT_0000788769 /DNA_START=363 /DNA_END=1244 /DNA_ORIENTATION=- /assembly_acc=CAM_ASM_000350
MPTPTPSSLRQRVQERVLVLRVKVLPGLVRHDEVCVQRDELLQVPLPVVGPQRRYGASPGDPNKIHAPDPLLQSSHNAAISAAEVEYGQVAVAAQPLPGEEGTERKLPRIFDRQRRQLDVDLLPQAVLVEVALSRVAQTDEAVDLGETQPQHVLKHGGQVVPVAGQLKRNYGTSQYCHHALSGDRRHKYKNDKGDGILVTQEDRLLPRDSNPRTCERPAEAGTSGNWARAARRVQAQATTAEAGAALSKLGGKDLQAPPTCKERHQMAELTPSGYFNPASLWLGTTPLSVNA